MRMRTLALAGLAAGLLATAASAEETAPAPASAPAVAPTTTSAAEEQVNAHGEKEYKERINIIARKPSRHDIGWLDSRDRSGWRDFTVWHGVRDERPMIARKSIGFHEPRPHATRAERVERISRGPLRGPAPSE